MKKALIAAGIAFLFSASVYADELTKVRILALSPVEARVVLKDETGQVRILIPGDSLLDGEFKVRQVLIDRLVLAYAADDMSNAMIWLFKPQSAQAQPRVQRFSVEAEEEAVVLDVIESSSAVGEVKPASAAN